MIKLYTSKMQWHRLNIFVPTDMSTNQSDQGNPSMGASPLRRHLGGAHLTKESKTDAVGCFPLRASELWLNLKMYNPHSEFFP